MLISNSQNQQSRTSFTTVDSMGRIRRKSGLLKRRSLDRQKSRQQKQEHSFQLYFSNCIKQCQNAQSPIIKIKSNPTRDILARNARYCTLKGTESSKKQAKRQLTPVKSKNQLNAELKIQKNIDLDSELRIAQFETKLERERILQEKLQKQLEIKDKIIQEQGETIKNLRESNQKLEMEKRELQIAIQISNKNIVQSENNLRTSKNTLNKLKKTIKESRVSELKYNIQELSEKLNALMRENQKLLQDSDALAKHNEELMRRLDFNNKHQNQSMKQTFLQNQLQRIREQVFANKTQKQIFLQRQLQKLNSSVFNVQKQKNLLHTKIHHLEHALSRQLQELREKNDKELKELKIKYCAIIAKLKEKYQKTKPTNTNTRNTDLLSSSHGASRSRKRSQAVLELSPQQFNH